MSSTTIVVLSALLLSADVEQTNGAASPATANTVPVQPTTYRGVWYGSGRDSAPPGRDFVYSEYDLKSNVPRYMIRTRRYKFIYNDGDINELYDLESDPGENVNLIHDSEYDSIAGDLRTRLFEHFNPENNPYKAGVSG